MQSMILPMKNLFFTLLIAVGLVTTAIAQQPQAAAANPGQPTKSKVKVTPPKAIDTPVPEPAFDEGKGPAVFRVLVGTDGLLHDPVMIKSSDSKQADANALKVIQQYRFKPATKDGVPVPVYINLEIDGRVH